MAPRKKDRFQSSLQDDMNQDWAITRNPPAQTLPIRTIKKLKFRVVADEAERLIERSSTGRRVTKLQPSYGQQPRRRGRPVA